MKNLESITGYPFVDHVDQNKTPKIHGAKDYLTSMYNGKHHSQIRNLHKWGVVKIGGYSYDFKPLLKKYVYKQYGGWTECYAPNKTLLRKSIYGRINKIIELD